jgi:hypothetical protein
MGKKAVRERVACKPIFPRKRQAPATENKTARKRPDLHDKGKANEGLDEYVVKASFPGRVREGPAKGAILEVVDDFVTRISQLSVRGSIIANEYIIESYVRNLPLPVLDQVFFDRCLRADASQLPLMAEIITRLQDHPYVPHDDQLRSILSHAARAFKTLFDNNVWMNFTRRVVLHVRQWCRHHDIDLPDVITSVVLGFPVRTPYVFNRDVHQFIVDMWARLYDWYPGGTLSPRQLRLLEAIQSFEDCGGVPHEIIYSLVVEECSPHQLFLENNRELRRQVKVWRRDYLKTPTLTFLPQKAPIQTMLREMCHMLEWKRVHDDGAGGFTMVPIYKVKRHHISICSSGLRSLLIKAASRCGADKLPPDVKEAIRRGKPCQEPDRGLLWSYFLDSGGIKTRGEFAHHITTDGVSVSIHFKRPKRPAPSTEVIAISPKVRVIANDPGRTTMFTGYEMGEDGKELFYRFTRKTYYSALRPSLTKLRRWDSRLTDIYAQLSAGSLKTFDLERRLTYMRVYCTQFHRLWGAKLQKKIARERFHLSSTKRALLDRFFASFTSGADKRKPVIVYGAAPVQATGRGELAVPVKRVFETCRRFYKTIKVDEYLTTQCHSRCHDRMHFVKNQGARNKTHGVLWCPTCKCLVNRDRDAARCIREIGLSNERPEYLSRRRPYEYRQVLTMIPPRKG